MAEDSDLEQAALISDVLDLIDTDDEEEAYIYQNYMLSQSPQERTYINRDAEIGHNNIMRDYFGVEGNPPVYPEKIFRRRFRMHSDLFTYVMAGVLEVDPSFNLQMNAAGKRGLTCLQKCAVALRRLTLGVSADSLDEYYRVSESSTLLYTKKFCQAVIKKFKPDFLRSPTTEETIGIHQANAERGLPGCLGSLDCMHWAWKNCPKAWHGQFKGAKGVPTIVLEAVATRDNRIWHAFFGCPGTLNDINILGRSPLVTNVMNRTFGQLNYSVTPAGAARTRGYFLTDGIYPDYDIFIKAFSAPAGNKKKLFTKLHESVRKEVECTFGILQARFHIISRPSKHWFTADMHDVMECCIILHNMIIEHQKQTGDVVDLEDADDVDGDGDQDVVPAESQILQTEWQIMASKLAQIRASKSAQRHQPGCYDR
jgi:hypothetical protein